MIKGTIHHSWPQALGIRALHTHNSQVVISLWFGAGNTTLDLSQGTPQRRDFFWYHGVEVEQLRFHATLADGRWVMHTIWCIENQIQARHLRVLDFDAIPEGHLQPPITLDPDLHDLAMIQGRLLAWRRHPEARSRLVELDERGHERPLHAPPDGWGELLPVTLPGGQQAAIYSGNVHELQGDTLLHRWEVRLDTDVLTPRDFRLLPAFAPWEEGGGLYFLRRRSSLRAGGDLWRARPDQPPEEIRVLDPLYGLLALPEGGLLALLPPSKTAFARVLFPEQGYYLTLNPAAMGLVNPAMSAVWWDEAHQALFLIGNGTLVQIPWAALRAHRRQKL